MKDDYSNGIIIILDWVWGAYRGLGWRSLTLQISTGMPNFRRVGDFVLLWSLLVLEPSPEPERNNFNVLLLAQRIDERVQVCFWLGL